MPTIEQIRAARALLDWSQSDLAAHADLSQTGIARIENGTNKPNSQTLEKIKSAFDKADIEFIDDGVRKVRKKVDVLSGEEGFHNFYQDLYRELENSDNKVVYVNNVDERLFVKWQGEERLREHTQQILKLGVRYKILIREGDEYLPAGKYAEYRCLTEEMFHSVSFYVYGEKLAILILEKTPRIYILREREIADSYRKQFDALWKTSKISKAA